MEPQDLYNEIVAFCISNTSEEIKNKYSRYFKKGLWDAYGLTKLLMSNKVNEIRNRQDIDIDTLRKTSKLLISGKKYEESSFAILFYKSFVKHFDRQIFNDIDIWFESGVRNWAHSDTICGELIYPMLKKDIIVYQDLHPWISATNKFQRRAVPVSLIKILKTTEDFHSFFSFIEPLMKDQEREVHQGVGWFLREAWKRKMEQTESFLLKWKESSPRLIYQYACEKMSPENKIRFRRTK